MAQPRVRAQLDLPPELDTWLKEHAAELGISRNALIVQVLSNYRDDIVADDLETAGAKPVRGT